jgi:hypothetical protein
MNGAGLVEEEIKEDGEIYLSIFEQIKIKQVFPKIMGWS